MKTGCDRFWSHPLQKCQCWSNRAIVILTKEFKRMPDRSLASKDISSTEAAKKLAEAKNSRASKDETLNKLNIKAVEDSHLDDSSDTSCL